MKLWQKSYFYVKNVAPQGDYVNLPTYVADPLAGGTAVARLRAERPKAAEPEPAGVSVLARCD